MKTLTDILKKYWQKGFRKKHYEYKQALREFSRSLTLIVDLDQLKDNVISMIREIIQVERILIYLYNPELNRFQIAESRGYAEKSNEQRSLFPEEPLVRWFSVNETYLIVSENPAIFSYFSDREKKIIRKIKIDFIYPLISMNRVTGLVCLGSDSVGNQFTREEIELLTTLLGQAALAFENAYLYQQQKARFKKMYRADRLATLGQLAAGAAHEIRNPLTSIRSTIQYLQKDLKDSLKGELVVDLIEEVDRINEIIEGLLSFSKPSKPVTERVDLELLLQQSLALATTTARKRKLKIALDFRAKQKFLKADPSQLKQVFLNIIMNALQAMDENGNLRISVNVNKNSGHFTTTSQSFFNIAFQDTGEGIPPANLERIFDPFFTTKKDGTGLGLSISYGIIQQHGGDIEIESVAQSEQSEEHGTKVRVTLPVC